MIGRVVSAKTKNTVTVIVERVSTHPLYKKTFARSKKYLADADNSIKEGDMVDLIKVKPVSKNKHWKVSKVLGRNLAEINEAELKAEAEGIIAQVMPEEKKEEPSVISHQTEKAIKKEEKPKNKKERKVLKAES